MLHAQEPPRLQAVPNAEKTLIRLELQGRTGISYDIEASTDLKVWAPVVSGQAGNGVLLNEQPLSSQYRFFRGRESGGSTNTPSISITPLVNTNASVSFLASTNGGSALLYSADGTQLRFTVPPLTLPEAEIITMTLVTNAVGLPFSQGILGAVRLEPDGLGLWGAGTLEISVAPGLDLRKIVSFTADGDGTSFHLTPDRVTTNSVVIPVTQLGLFGSALALDAEVASTAGLGAFVAHSDSAVHALAACPPESANAQFFAEQLAELAQRYSQEVASALLEARRSQPGGDAGDTFNPEQAVSRVENVSCGRITEAINFMRDTGGTSCAVSRVLLRHVMWLRGVRLFLRLPDGPGCGSLPPSDVCGMLSNCIREIRECCENGIRGNQQLAAISEIVRLGQVVGPGCSLAAEISNAERFCTPGQWSGILYLIIAGEESTTNSLAGIFELKTHSDTFLGHVVESSELGSDQGTNVNLRVEGRVAAEIDETRIQTAAGDCGGYFGHRHQGHVAHGLVAYNVSFTISPGQTPSIIVFPSPEPMLQGRQTYHDYSRNGFYKIGEGGRECDANVRSESSHEDWTYAGGAAILGKPATFRDNELTGSADLDRTQMNLDGIGRFGWRFKRQPERP